jgi:peptide/nickel transport system permease protein
MSAIDPNEVPLLLSTDNEGRSPHTSGPRLTREEGSRRRGQAREGLVHSLFRNRKAVAGLIILTIFVLAALLAPILFPGNPSEITSLGAQPPSAEHLLGTTPKGQDVLALTLSGARSSLLVGFAVGMLATSIGILIGLSAAYFGRSIDNGLSLLTNVFLLIPGLPLLVILAAFLPPGIGTVILVLTLTGWAGSARVLRSQALSIRGKDFVASAIVTGEKATRIMFREILPNMASVVMITLLGTVIFGIGAQAGLEFLGLGDPGVVSWGTNLYWANNDGALLSRYWWVFVPSGVCIALVAFALALVNYGVDEVSNPRLRTARRRPPTAATEVAR